MMKRSFEWRIQSRSNEQEQLVLFCDHSHFTCGQLGKPLNVCFVVITFLQIAQTDLSVHELKTTGVALLHLPPDE